VVLATRSYFRLVVTEEIGSIADWQGQQAA